MIPFDAQPRDIFTVKGNDPAQLNELLSSLLAQKAEGGTDIYAATVRAMDAMEKLGSREEYQVAIILMTDGRSEGQPASLFNRWEKAHIPVFTIMFADADPAQLEIIAKRTKARNFDGRKNLIEAFREARGYN